MFQKFYQRIQMPTFYRQLILLFCTRLCLALLANSEDNYVLEGRLCAKDIPAAMEENFTLQLRLRMNPPFLPPKYLLPLPIMKIIKRISRERARSLSGEGCCCSDLQRRIRGVAANELWRERATPMHSAFSCRMHD